jgi:DNA (cytosine-5)-methyltransferase 1
MIAGLRIGSLFSGYGGLDMAVEEVTGATVAWHCEWEDAPSAILAHHWPGVPNFHDVSKVDWSSVEQVDILTGGFPCQDVSLAGARKGMGDGTRSGLWSEFAKAIEVIRPRLVVIENVRGLLSATAHSNVEPCAWCLGTEPDEPALRALGAVLGDLADLGYDAEWKGLRAADAGAPHNRFRVFIVAHSRG